MRRTLKTFDFPAVTLTLPGASSSLNAFDRFARYRSRYLLHGVVAFVGVAALSTIALHPRPAPTAAAAAAPVVADVTTPLLSVDVQPQAPTATDAAAAVTDTPVADASTETPPAATDPPAAPAKPITHTVEAGETLRMLAARYSVSPETIMGANGLTDPDMLQVGQDLVILPTDGVLYTLQAGESIKRVAEHFGVDVTDIVQANDLGSNPDLVQPGTQLVVPGAEPDLVSQAAADDTAQADTSGDQQAAALGGGVSLPVDATAHAVPSTRTYEVQDGDTLASIAQKFGVDINTILSSNGIDDPDTIHPGSDLSILPVSGLQYTVEPDETLADIAYRYQVDLGLLLDYNDLNDPDMIRVGAKLVVPGGVLRPDTSAAPAAAAAPAPRTQSASAGAAVVQVPAVPKPAAPAKPAPSKPAPAPAPAPDLVTGGGGGSVVANAMKYLGYRYVFGGTSPSGFDCSGFVYYIHNHSGAPVSRSMWQQYNGGAHVSMDSLQPGDTVFFANTYEPGLSHDGIYIGGGKFIHAADENTGVTISSLYTAYWQAHYVGATRLWD